MTEDRLLTDEEMDKIYILPSRQMNWPFHLRYAIRRAQDIKTASIKDAEFEKWQADYTDEIATKYEKRCAEVDAKIEALIEEVINYLDKHLGYDYSGIRTRELRSLAKYKGDDNG